MCDRLHDFLIIGAGLYGPVFLRVATDRGYRCLLSSVVTARALDDALRLTSAH